jgi:hypothetical protein
VNDEKYDKNNMVKTITSYLPSGLPLDSNGMQKIAAGLLSKRKKKRIEEEA